MNDSNGISGSGEGWNDSDSFGVPISIRGRARVILMPPLPVSPNNFLKQLLTHPVLVAGFYPLTRDEEHVR